MMRYCWAHEGSVGFVISQDGDVRAMIKYEYELIICEKNKIAGIYFY